MQPFRQRRDPSQVADVEALEREHDGAAAALPETWPERESLEPAHMRHARALAQHLARDFDGTPLEVSTADRMSRRIARDNHFGARLARRGTLDACDCHEHGGVAVRE